MFPDCPHWLLFLVNSLLANSFSSLAFYGCCEVIKSKHAVIHEQPGVRREPEGSCQSSVTNKASSAFKQPVPRSPDQNLVLHLIAPLSVSSVPAPCRSSARSARCHKRRVNKGPLKWLSQRGVCRGFPGWLKNAASALRETWQKEQFSSGFSGAPGKRGRARRRWG